MACSVRVLITAVIISLIFPPSLLSYNGLLIDSAGIMLFNVFLLLFFLYVLICFCYNGGLIIHGGNSVILEIVLFEVKFSCAPEAIIGLLASLGVGFEICYS